MSTFNAVLPVFSLLVGAGLSYAAEERRYRRLRRDQASDSLRSQRTDAYRMFVKNAHSAAHHIGRATPGCPMPLEDAPEAWAAIDRDVARDLYELELLATDETLDAARTLRQDLVAFRQTVIDGARYLDDPYRAALGTYQASRTRFLRRARTEIVDG
ncbi:MAG: hypothetical protein ACXVYY_16175 [Oryzihumus sp.]